MDIMSGIVVIVFIVGLFIILALNIVRSDRSDNYYPDKPKPHYLDTPMWTTTTTYGPKCSSAKIVDDRLIKLCIREPNHDGDHQYKIINLGGPEKNDEELS